MEEMGINNLPSLIKGTTRLLYLLREESLNLGEEDRSRYNSWLTTRCGYTVESLKYLLSAEKVRKQRYKCRDDVSLDEKKLYIFSVESFSTMRGLDGDAHCFGLLFDNGWFIIDSYVLIRDPECRDINDIDSFLSKLCKLKYPIDQEIYRELFDAEIRDPNTLTFFISIEEYSYQKSNWRGRFDELVERAKNVDIEQEYLSLARNVNDARRLLNSLSSQ